jgi:hypothetical protein
MSEATPEPTVSAPPNALVASGMLTPADFHGWLAVDAVPDEAGRARQRSGQRFQDDGDVVLLLGTVPASLLEPDFTPDLAALPLTLLGLIHEGVVKSACAVGAEGLPNAWRKGCGEDGAAEARVVIRGVTLDFTAWSPEARATEAVGLDGSRFVITVSATDVGRVIRQAHIMDVPAMALGRVGGAGVVFKTIGGETSVDPGELTSERWKEWLCSPA